jgi:hypothetical protein
MTKAPPATERRAVGGVPVFPHVGQLLAVALHILWPKAITCPENLEGPGAIARGSGLSGPWAVPMRATRGLPFGSVSPRAQGGGNGRSVPGSHASAPSLGMQAPLKADFQSA